jgi:hypothetical protein
VHDVSTISNESLPSEDYSNLNVLSVSFAMTRLQFYFILFSRYP